MKIANMTEKDDIFRPGSVRRLFRETMQYYSVSKVTSLCEFFNIYHRNLVDHKTINHTRAIIIGKYNSTSIL